MKHPRWGQSTWKGVKLGLCSHSSDPFKSINNTTAKKQKKKPPALHYRRTSDLITLLFITAKLWFISLCWCNFNSSSSITAARVTHTHTHSRMRVRTHAHKHECEQWSIATHLIHKKAHNPPYINGVTLSLSPVPRDRPGLICILNCVVMYF